MNIIGYHITDKIASNNSNSTVVTNNENISDFLFLDFGECIKVFYHLDYSVACILKALNLSLECLKELAETGDLSFDNLEIQYIAGVWFAIKNTETKQWAGFSDTAQYSNHSLAMNQNKTTCLSYAQIAKKTGEAVYSSLVKLGLSPKSLTSPVSAYNKEILSHISLPTIDDIPKDAAWAAYQCCHGGWVEAYKQGHFLEAWDYDIKSAYGSELAKLIDTRFCKWIEDTNFREDAIYGYCLCEVTILKNFSPIIVNGFTPIGTFCTYMTKAEMEFIDNHDIGVWKIIEGYWCVPSISEESLKNMQDVKPLKSLIKDLYRLKEETADSIHSNNIKRILAGIWGKTLEVTTRLGDNFNPCWGAEVESRIRLKVAEAVIRNNAQEHLLSITVDGVLTDQPFNLLLDNGTMGSWKLSSHCPVVIIGSGIQAVKDKPSKAQFALNYNWLLNEIKILPRANTYKIHGTSPMTLLKANIHKKFKDLGKVQPYNRLIEIDNDIKRCYTTKISNGRELLKKHSDTVPWDYSLVAEKRTEE